MADNVTSREPRYVGFWKRLLAFFIDSVIVLVVFAIIAVAIFGRNYLELSDRGKTLWAESCSRSSYRPSPRSCSGAPRRDPGKMLISRESSTPTRTARRPRES